MATPKGTRCMSFKLNDHEGVWVYSNPDAAAARAVEYVAMGFTAVKFDPAGPYSTFDPRQPSLAAPYSFRNMTLGRIAERRVPHLPRDFSPYLYCYRFRLIKLRLDYSTFN